tara:strand:- start:238 stop:513 length:276 start_codon:yes stop_codon:yes gene_type:complete
MYVITDYTKQRAKKLLVDVKVSTKKNKKIDVIKNGKKIASIGAKGYNDYPTYLISKGKKFADERRRLYRIRHKGENLKIGSPGYYAWFLLW